MTIPHNRRTDVFTDWLDAQVTGTSTPDHELATDADLANLCAAADQFHGLDERLGQYATRSSPTTRSWEDIMSANPALSPASLEAPSFRRPSAPSWWRGGSSHNRFDRFVTGALAVALVVAIGGGAWLAADGNPFGGGNQPPATIGFGGFGPEGGDSNRIVPEVTVSPDDQMSSIPYPSAAECVVEAPDREWVEDHIQQVIDITEQTSPALYQWPIEPTQEEIDGVMSAFRLWQACQLVDAGPTSARFTLETPWVTKTRGTVWGQAEAPVSDERMQYLIDLAMAETEAEQRAISAVYFEGTPDASIIIEGTPEAGGTPMALDGPVHEFVPAPEDATPVARSGGRSALPTIFADGIEMIGPDRASAQVFFVSPQTLEVSLIGPSYTVEFVLVDGVWLIDFYGEPNRG